METAPQRLDRILKENNLLIAQRPLGSSIVDDGSIIIHPSTYTAIFADEGKEKQSKTDEQIPSQTAEETNG